jgi:hypothetical protein
MSLMSQQHPSLIENNTAYYYMSSSRQPIEDRPSNEPQSFQQTAKCMKSMITRGTPNQAEQSYRSITVDKENNNHRGYSKNARESHSPHFNQTLNAPLAELTNTRSKVSYKI